ncbi:MAG: hypothetical protein LUC94_14655 [Clostridiales bacterium]|nr:hypothetical protein [Clostridiales bacterium]
MKKRHHIAAVSAAVLFFAAFALPIPAYAADGWQQDDTGSWVYYENEKPVRKQWIQNED